MDFGGGILRLTPTWVPRNFLHPGKRIKLAPTDWYALGTHRGGIDERWFGSTTEAANDGRAEDEGLSYVVFEGERFLLRDAVEFYNKGRGHAVPEGMHLYLHWHINDPKLTDTEIEKILGKLDDLTKWADEIKEYALDAALNHGKEWQGWKLVEGRSNRKYTNETVVAGVVTDAGYDPYEHKVLGVTAMQKLLGKSRFEELLAAYIEKPQGKPTLVLESDKRPAMNTAKNDFMEENDYE